VPFLSLGFGGYLHWVHRRASDAPFPSFRAVTSHVPYIVPTLSILVGNNWIVPPVRAFGRERVLKRLEVGASKKDLFYHLSGEELPESDRPSVDKIAQEGALAIVAGSDTTNRVLASLFYYLLLNPGVYKCLQEEVDSAFKDGEEPLDTVKLSHMEWLNGCMWVTVHLLKNSFLPFRQ